MTAKISFYTSHKVGVKGNPLNAAKTALKCTQLMVVGCRFVALHYS